MDILPATRSPCHETPELADELAEDQRAFLESIAADEQPPSDAELDAMFIEDQRRRSERELDDIANEFMTAYGEWLELVIEADTALVEQQKYERIADAISA